MQNQKSAVSIFSSVTHAISFSESGLTEGENLHQTCTGRLSKRTAFSDTCRQNFRGRRLVTQACTGSHWRKAMR